MRCPLPRRYVGIGLGGLFFQVKYSLFIDVHCVEVDARLCAELLFVGVLELWIREELWGIRHDASIHTAKSIPQHDVIWWE